MVTLARPAHLMRHWRALAPHLQAALVAGGAVGLGCLLMPGSLFERFVMASGVPAILSAAEPPLGLTARMAMALTLGSAIGGFVWLGLVMLEDEDVGAWWRAIAHRLPRRPMGDVHPPRPPVFAQRDLGTPFLEVRAQPAEPAASAVEPLELTVIAPPPAPVAPPPVPTAPVAVEVVAPAPLAAPPVERDLPRDWDLPLAAFDPEAVRPAPQPAAELVPPLVVPDGAASQRRPQLIDPGDRFETFALAPALRAEHPQPAAAPTAAPVTGEAPAAADSVDTLLARLERGLGRAPADADPAQRGSVADTLGDLRRLATGGR